MSNHNSKQIRIVLVAYTRIEYTEVISVPKCATDHEITELVEQRNQEVDYGAYKPDIYYCEKGSHSYDLADDDSEINYRAVLENGEWIIDPVKV